MDHIAVVRAQWLAQIADAIDSAQSLAWQLRTREGASVEARQLYDRLEAAKVELESIGLKASRPGSMSDPDWLQALGWNGSLTDPKD